MEKKQLSNKTAVSLYTICAVVWAICALLNFSNTSLMVFNLCIAAFFFYLSRKFKRSEK